MIDNEAKRVISVRFSWLMRQDFKIFGFRDTSHFYYIFLSHIFSFERSERIFLCPNSVEELHTFAELRNGFERKSEKSHRGALSG